MESKNEKKENKKVYARLKEKIEPNFKGGQKPKGGTIMKYINKKRLVDVFCELARIHSPSGQEEVIANILVKKMKKLGLAVQKDSYGNIIAKLAGDGDPIILCAHMDTVAVGSGKVKTQVHGGKITSDGTTILGADNKDSIAAILETLEILKEKNLKRRSIEVVLTRQEEDISKGAKELDFSLISGKECVISDQAAPYGTITISAPCCYGFDVEIRGKRCHVKEPEKGVNAALILSRTIAKLPLGRVDKLTTSNIAYVVSGLKGVVDVVRETPNFSKEGRNNIPDLALVYGEVRGANEKKVISTLARIENIFTQTAKSLKGNVVFRKKKLAGGYLFSKKDYLVSLASKIFLEQGVKPKLFNSTGGSDANILNHKGIHTIVISSSHRNNHQKSEYLIVKDLVNLADFFVRLVTRC
jgi:tripeptide aminopeptidase